MVSHVGEEHQHFMFATRRLLIEYLAGQPERTENVRPRKAWLEICAPHLPDADEFFPSCTKSLPEVAWVVRHSGREQNLRLGEAAVGDANDRHMRPSGDPPRAAG
jgi:hypothetical protein